MTYRSFLSRLRPLSAAILAIFAVGGTLAQTAPITPAGPTVELSPFVINASDDTGYTATETLSGTRLRMPAKDVASAMTIVTSEFMNDIGARRARGSSS